MKYLVFGEMKDGTIDRFRIFANTEAEAEAKVISFGYDSAKAFDWDIQFIRIRSREKGVNA